MTSQMKRVFASTEYKVLGRASYGGHDGRQSSQEMVDDEMKVSYRIPEVCESVGNEGHAVAEEEEDVFATVEASEPLHIQEAVAWRE